MLLLACSLHTPPEPAEVEAFVQWAARHPVARADDAPALQQAKSRLEAFAGTEPARDALARVVTPSR
jgi:hypothetical protein